MKKLIIVLCIGLLSCEEGIVPISSPYQLPKGIVRRVYEAPTYKSYSMTYHLVIKNADGSGQDIEVTKELAAQYSVGDTLK